MTRFCTIAFFAALLVGGAGLTRAAEEATAGQIDGLITKPSAHSVDITLDRLETSLKQHGFVIFTRLDHAAAAAAVGLKMPRETVLVFGNPRLGTPNFLKYPTLAIDLPIKALVWEDAGGKVWVSYNSQKYLSDHVYFRHGPPPDSAMTDRIEGLFAAITDEATRLPGKRGRQESVTPDDRRPYGRRHALWFLEFPAYDRG
jgi:uncharacterized protein (DUF302 family)